MPGESTRTRALVMLAGVLAAACAFLPCRDLAPPPPRAVDPAEAAPAELLALPGVGCARAEALWAERLLGSRTARER